MSEISSTAGKSVAHLDASLAVLDGAVEQLHLGPLVGHHALTEARKGAVASSQSSTLSHHHSNTVRGVAASTINLRISQESVVLST